MTKSFQSILESGEARMIGLCRDLSVRELRLFGSAATGNFKEASSDVDMVVEFADGDKPGIADRYLALAEGLEAIFHRPVDLITARAIKNPVFQKIIDETSRLLYAA